MKLYTNTVPVLKGNLMPNIDASGVIHEGDKIECVPEGSIFKVLFIDQLCVYLKHEGKVYPLQSSIVKEFFVETDMNLGG
jgi:hypothetical protein